MKLSRSAIESIMEAVQSTVVTMNIISIQYKQSSKVTKAIIEDTVTVVRIATALITF